MRKRILTCLLVVLIFVLPPGPARAQEALRVYYAGPAQAKVRSAIALDPHLELVESPQGAQALVLNGTAPDLPALQAALADGAGLVLVLGPDISEESVQALLGSPIHLEVVNEPVSLAPAAGVTDPVVESIVWNSAPQVRERVRLVSPAPLQPLIVEFENGETVLGRLDRPGAPVYFLTVSLEGGNASLQDWAYFNYLIDQLATRAAGGEPESFSSYPGAPVPHANQRLILFGLLAGALALAVLAYGLVRRYSLRHPEALDVLVADTQEFIARQESTDWHNIGFHRPLGGFMLALMLGLIFFIPLIIYQNLVLPVYILPSAQALGIWGRVTQFFNLLWLLFDMGTSAAFIKYFAQYRVHEPRRAVLFGQIFVWWQALSGALQVAVMVVIASAFLPETPYALYAWSIIIHTLIQIPGFFLVTRHALMGWQRFDYGQIVYLASYLIFPILTQPLIVTGMVYWGQHSPVFGGAMGGLLGLGLAAYVTEALTFLLGLWLYTRLGYNARVLFLAHFDWATVKQAFHFGVFEMLGSVAWAVGQAAEILITQTRLVNFTEVWGNWVLAQNFVFAFNAMQTLNENLMPSISESISHARVKLSQYYSAMAYKWEGAISAFVAAVLLAVADRFILGASGPEFVRAASYAVPLIIWGAFQYPSWVGDIVQLGSGRPYLKALLVAMEQIVRIVLAWVLLERLQINALIVAYFAGLFAKGIAAYIINDRLCFPQRFFFWQSLGAPALAGAVHFLLLRWLTGLIWQGDQVTSVLIFLIGILFSYPVYAFFYGLAGGWDDATLGELRHAVDLSGFMRPLAWLFWRATAFGAALSPLHNRFPIDIRAAALVEAEGLTGEKVRLTTDGKG